MKPFIIDKLEELQERYEDVQILLNNTNIMNNQNSFFSLSREYSQLSNISYYFLKWRQAKKDLVKTEMMLNDLEIREIVKEEIKELKIIIKTLEKQLKLLLLPKDINDNRNCFLEIRAGTGGDEAAIFAGDLFRMYARYSEHRQWNVEIISFHEGEKGGYKEIISKISGNNVYSKLKFECGGHRVQRMPATDSQGRIHTSTCTIAVIPEVQETEMPNIIASDLKIDTFRSSGAGGQHVNTTDSAIRITHIPTGIISECQEERSQHKNKAKAISVLLSRIHASKIAKRQQEETLVRRNLLGSGDRSDRKRTYNFPKHRVTDHRINLTVYCLDEIMSGNLDILIKPIIQEYHTDQLAILTDKEK
ncbi:Peptide chain release factor RF1 [Candidatus Ecksteinia adelgidicola]|nr:Peptide chain release factor RF1 [Candidatus Ecksteinia adelgidicola]